METASRQTIANIYANSLFEIAIEGSNTKDYIKQMRLVLEIFEGWPEVRLLLEGVTVSHERKKTFAKTVLSPYLSKEVANFIFVLIDKGRMGVYSDIVAAFERLEYKHEGYHNGIAITAKNIEMSKLLEMEKACSSLFKANIKLKNEVDASVLGGVKLMIDDKMIDMTLKTRLAEMYKTMKN
jgi:F-type H+-transporting ATPase subunit delta